MSENKKLELLDQYDDVTFALLMDEYAEEEGARLRKEFEEAQAAGEVSDTSDSLDEKCLQMIHRDFAKKRGKDNVRKIIRMTSKVAVAVMVFFGVLTSTVMTVDALRIPVLNFIVTHFDVSSKINFGTDISNKEHDPNNTIDDYLSVLLPSTYTCLSYENTDGLIYSLYKTEDDHVAILDMEEATGDYFFDSEEADSISMSIDVFDALFISKDSRLQMIWFDPEQQILYHFTATEFGETEFIEICKELAQHYKK